MFKSLKIEVEETQRQEKSAAIAEINQRVESEADLDRKCSILKEAGERYPNEPLFQQSLKLIKERRDLVNSIVARARHFEESGQFGKRRAASGTFCATSTLNIRGSILKFSVWTGGVRSSRAKRPRLAGSKKWTARWLPASTTGLAARHSRR